MLCEEVKGNLSAYIDKELDKEKEIIIKEHLEACQDCSLQRDLILKSADKIKNINIPAINPQVLDNILNSISDYQNTSSLFSGLYSFVKTFSVLTVAFILMLTLSPFGLMITSLLRGLIKDIYYLFSLLIKAALRFPIINENLVVSLIFLGASIIPIFILGKILKGIRVGGLAHEK